MDTILLGTDPKDLEEAAKFIQDGEVVGIPTETVYGLAADALNPGAVKKIFQAKGRPADNPLIVHISAWEQIRPLVTKIPKLAEKLAEKFWPGPLTIILPKSDLVPEITSGGLDTVGIRMPSHPVARALITCSNRPLAAPSANISGYPSTTSAQHVMEDMHGKIAAVIDGGICSVGVESTVIMLESETRVRILRPGFITAEMLKTVADEVIIDPAITHDLQEGQQARSPGMKYKHYSPHAKVFLVEGNFEAFSNFVNQQNQEDTWAVTFSQEECDKLNCHSLSYGVSDAEQAQQIFGVLRHLDELHAKTVYVRSPKTDGVGLAVYNRLIRAAGFEVIHL